MCHFVTLIVPTDDADAVGAIMKRHGRAADPIDNPSIRKVLKVGERQFLTTSGHCDCGTVLAPRHETAASFEEKLAKHAARLKRKGWSEAKIARTIEDRRRADARPDGGDCDSLEMWNAVLCDLREQLPASLMPPCSSDSTGVRSPPNSSARRAVRWRRTPNGKTRFRPSSMTR